MKHNNTFSDSQKAPKPTRAERKARKRAAENDIVSVHKRPIICPPDRAGRHPAFRLGGIVCRALVIWLAVSGLILFISNALQFGVSAGVIFLTALATVALVTLFSHSAIGKLVAGAGTAGALGTLIALNPRLPVDIPFGFVSLYNAALTRLHNVGYLTYARYKVKLSALTATPDEELIIIGTCMLTVLVGILFTLCLSKRVRLVPPAIVATSFLVVILTFNIYSNKIESNLGIALVIVSFASVLVMGAYDRLYHRKDDKHYDTEFSLFEDNDRPALPAEYADAKALRAARKQSKASMRTGRRQKTVTVDDELTDYFNTRKKQPRAKPEKDPVAARAAKEKKRELRRQVRCVKRYDRVTAESRTAMGGYAAAAVMLTCLIAIGLPAMLIKGNFNTIDAIDSKVELARDYVTALLRGDERALDRLEYGADKNNFAPHSTNLEHLEFTQKQIFYIRTRYSTNFYLRGWIGTDYEAGAWTSVDADTLKTYQDLFGEDVDPAEDMRYNFYHYMKPALVDGEGEEFPAYYNSKFVSNLDYGFVNTLVSLRRVNSPSTLTYFPSSYAAQYGLFKFDSTEKNDMTFVNYYDGLYTGRNFHESGVNYATVAYAPVMTNRFWIENQAALEAAYNLHKEALLARSTLRTAEDGTVSSNLTLEVYEKGRTATFLYTLEDRRNGNTSWSFIHNASGYRREVNGDGTPVWIIETAYGTLELTMNGKRVVGARVTSSDGYSLTDAYDGNMTDEERQALMEHLESDRAYSDFVYRTYLDRADSIALRELAATIRAQAHTEEERITETLIPDDPETPEDDSYVQKDRYTENVPADVSRADERNSTDAEVYIQRDRLVRNIIDYIITELECTYTITPDLSNIDATRDGVENFLFNTKEGYCVQYASAVALLLREMNIPARYVEGYVANGLRKTAGQDFIYDGYVLDEQAHAWVEVWYDGVGWIQYETTPEYYVGMYGTSSAVSTAPSTPVIPDVTPALPEETEPESEEESDTDADETESGTGEEDNSEEITRAGLIGLAILAVLITIFAILRAIASAAAHAEARRQSVVDQVREENFGQNTSPEDRREMALSMADAIRELLAILELSPQPGEFRDDYAERLTADLAIGAVKASGKAADRNAAAMDLPNIHIALDGIAAEEFGHGMSLSEMKEVAALYICLHSEVRRRVPGMRRMKLRYIKRKI